MKKIVLSVMILFVANAIHANEQSEMSPAKQKAAYRCEHDKSLTPGTEEYKRCMRGTRAVQVRRGQMRQASPEKQRALRHCEQKGLTPGTDPFKKCLKGYKRTH